MHAIDAHYKERYHTNSNTSNRELIELNESYKLSRRVFKFD